MSDQQIVTDSGFDFEELDAIADEAIAQARAENLRLGIPNISHRHGVWWYELPSGEWTTTRPEFYSQVPGLPEAATDSDH